MAISELARGVFLTYFVTHIPATMLIDAQVVLPPRVVPKFARNALRWHISTNNDVLMAHQPAWLRSLVMCELVFQLPFFFVAISALRRRDEGAKGWLLAYGAHTATTLAPILQYIWESDAIASELERWKLIGVYSPYLVVPLWIVSCTIGEGKIFVDAKTARSASSRRKRA